MFVYLNHQTNQTAQRAKDFTMIETVIASGIGSAIGASFANQGLYNKFGNIESKCDSIARDVSNVDSKCDKLASQMNKGFDSVMKTLNRLEIMQFLQLTNAPTENGRITHTYDDGRKLSYVLDSKDILEYQADGQLAYKNGEECPVVTESFVESGVEFKVVRYKNKEYMCSDALGYSVDELKCLSQDVKDVDVVKKDLDYATSCLDGYKERLSVLQKELARLMGFGAIRRWWNSKTMCAIAYMIKECQRCLSHNGTAVQLWTNHYESCVDFSKKFPRAYQMLTSPIKSDWNLDFSCVHFVEVLSAALKVYKCADVLASIRDGLMTVDEAVDEVCKRMGSFVSRHLVREALTSVRWRKISRFRFNAVVAKNNSWTPNNIKLENGYYYDYSDNLRFDAKIQPNGRVAITFKS